MTLKNRISLLVSLLFTLLFGIASTIIFVFYSNFREDEFKNRLENKSLTTVKLLSNIKEKDQKIMELIDKNSINKLFDEKTLIFDANFKLIYSSIDDTKINWSIDDLKYLKRHKTFFKKQGVYEYYGVFYDSFDKDYYILISANDSYGNRKLTYLRYILLISYLFFTALCWVLTSFMVKNLMRPLVNFHQKIKKINENNLDTRITLSEFNNEIDLIANEFNFMMDRIELSYQKQKEFTSHASHELRTPLSRITAQIENTISNNSSDSVSKNFLKGILNDVNQLTELIHSLLILSKLENTKMDSKESHRLDELLFSTIESLNKSYPDFIISFDIEENENLDSLLEIKGNNKLLEIAMSNVLKNACVYSDNKQAKVKIFSNGSQLHFEISNSGKTLTENEQKNLFQPFMRGENSKGTSGFGLGLRIVQRILILHKSTINYQIQNNDTNVFVVSFHG